MIDKNHPPIKYGNTGVLIINLGTPDSTNWFDIRKYLKEFLSDRRVIEVNPLVWQIVLANIQVFKLSFHPNVLKELSPIPLSTKTKLIWSFSDEISIEIFLLKLGFFSVF